MPIYTKPDDIIQYVKNKAIIPFVNLKGRKQWDIIYVRWHTLLKLTTRGPIMAYILVTFSFS